MSSSRGRPTGIERRVGLSKGDPPLVDWGTAGGREFETDCNDDGIVDADDLAIVLAGRGPCS